MDIRRLQFKRYRRFTWEVYIKELFQSWHKTLRRYEQAWGTSDLAYVYNEQAQVGLLAIAAEKARGLPFIEFSAKRHQAKRDYSGRADLSIRRLAMNKKKELWVEAEPVSVNYEDTVTDLASRMRGPFNEAKKSVRSLAEAGWPRLALVFVKLIGASYASFDPESLKDRLCKATKQLNADFCAVHFCNPDLWPQSPHNDCPGIAAVGKVFSNL